MGREKPTKVQKFITHIQNHRLLSVLVVIGIVVCAISAFTDAVSRLGTLCHNLFGSKTQMSAEVHVNTKRDIRSLLERVNPDILRRVDDGANEISVLLGQTRFAELNELSKRLDFANYLAYKERPDVISIGRNNKIPGFLSDYGNDAMQLGCTFYPKDALRR